MKGTKFQYLKPISFQLGYPQLWWPCGQPAWRRNHKLTTSCHCLSVLIMLIASLHTFSLHKSLLISLHHRLLNQYNGPLTHHSLVRFKLYFVDTWHVQSASVSCSCSCSSFGGKHCLKWDLTILTTSLTIIILISH